MPREVIGNNLPYESKIEVNWRRDGDAQIGILGSKPFVFLTATDSCNCLCTPQMNTFGIEVKKPGAPAEIESAYATHMSLFGDLNSRKDFNDLIQVLRRARDQVHGKDA